MREHLLPKTHRPFLPSRRIAALCNGSGVPDRASRPSNGSGVNDTRPTLHKLLAQHDCDVLVVEHKDRLTRFGFRWCEALCLFRVAVVNPWENHTNDRMEDWVAILTSFSARLDGQRRGRTKTQAAIKALPDAS